VAYRDELEAMRARLAAMEEEVASARSEASRLKNALASRGSRELTPPLLPRTPDPRWRSIPGGEPTPVTVINESPRKVEVFWLSYEGRERSAGTPDPGIVSIAVILNDWCRDFGVARTPTAAEVINQPA
jgi:hypothetical protein